MKHELNFSFDNRLCRLFFDVMTCELRANYSDDEWDEQMRGFATFDFYSGFRNKIAFLALRCEDINFDLVQKHTELWDQLVREGKFRRTWRNLELWLEFLINRD